MSLRDRYIIGYCYLALQECLIKGVTDHETFVRLARQYGKSRHATKEEIEKFLHKSFADILRL